MQSILFPNYAGREFESWQDFEMVTHNAWFELGKEGRNQYKWISR